VEVLQLPCEHEDLRLLRRVEYDQLIASDVFADEKIELLDGFLVWKPRQQPPEASLIQRVTELLIVMFAVPDRATVRCQLPLALSDISEPEPDFAVVPNGSYDEEHPTSAYFLVEVSHTTLARDRRKASLYARAQVPEYWIVDVENQLVEVFTEPVGDAYTRVTPYRRGEAFAPRAFADVAIAVDSIFGG
jgi:Uma2 family endonuclease